MKKFLHNYGIYEAGKTTLPQSLEKSKKGSKLSAFQKCAFSIQLNPPHIKGQKGKQNGSRSETQNYLE